MNTHTIRNKNKPNPILSLSPKFFEMMKASPPDAVCLVLSKFQKDYKAQTGKSITLDYEQNQAFLSLWNADERGYWTTPLTDLKGPLYKVKATFIQGFIGSLCFDLEENLEVADHFFSMLEKEMNLEKTTEFSFP